MGAEGVPALLAVPVSFVSEHIETLEEMDVEYRELAAKSGIAQWGRVPALGTNELFIDDLAEAVIEALPFVGAMVPPTQSQQQRQQPAEGTRWASAAALGSSGGTGAGAEGEGAEAPGAGAGTAAARSPGSPLVPQGSVADLLAAYDSERFELLPPVREMWQWGFTRSAETWNGRFAMMGLVLVLIAASRGQGLLKFLSELQ